MMLVCFHSCCVVFLRQPLAQCKGLLLAILLALLQCLPTQAQTPVVGADSANLTLKVVQIEVAHEVPTHMGLSDMISGQSVSFVPQADLNIVDRSWANAHTWIRLTLRADRAPAGQEAAQAHVLEISKSYLDDIRLYSPATQQHTAWREQKAGDTVALKDWFIKGLHPRFELPSAQELAASPGSQQVLYLRINYVMPAQVNFTIQTDRQSAESAQLNFLTLGVCLGAMLLAALMALALRIVNKDSLFGWYCAYAVAAAMSNASHSGLAHYMLWPVAGPWPGAATHTGLLFASFFQLQFCRMLAQPSKTKPILSRIALVLSIACLLVAITYAFSPLEVGIPLYMTSMCLALLSMSISSAMVYRVWRAGSALAGVWMLAFIPLFVSVVVGFLDGIGVLDGEMGYFSPLYAGAFEVVVLGLALQWFARERHGQQERLKALASTDPLTGFASAESFRQHLDSASQRYKESGQDTAVAYVFLRNGPSGGQRLERLLLRSVRVLRAATSTQDTVARLEGRLLALLMPGMGMGETLSARLSRMIALGLMPENGEDGEFLKFRIAYTTLGHYANSITQLDTDLRELLNDEQRWGSRPIRVLDHRKSAVSRPREVIDSSGLEDIWNQAIAQDQPPVSPLDVVPSTTAPSPHISPPRNR